MTIWTFESEVWKTENRIDLTSFFVACSFLLLPPELFQIVISCKIVNSLMKFKFIHKITATLEKFLVIFNLLQGPDITCLGARRVCIPDLDTDI